MLSWWYLISNKNSLLNLPDNQNLFMPRNNKSAKNIYLNL